MPHTKKLVVVLGAHRSGTSVCAAAVQSLGAFMGEQLDYSNDENPKGFFEHPDIVDFNDRLLTYLGGSWDSPLFDGSLALGGIQSSNADAVGHKMDRNSLQQEAAELLRNIFGGSTFAAIKDPRFCQLLDFWRPVFTLAGFAPESVYFVHTMRPVAEVAASQKSRSEKNPDFYDIGQNVAEGAALWLSLSGQALAGTRECNAWYLRYRDLLEKPDQLVAELANFLDVEPEPESVAKFCAEFVDPSLYRSVGVDEIEAHLEKNFPQALEFEASIEVLAGATGALVKQLDAALSILDRPDTQLAIYRAMAPAFGRLSNRAREDRQQAELLHGQLEDMSQHAFQQKSELEKTIANMEQEHAGVLVPLRSELSQMQQATESQTEQLNRQAAVNSALNDQLSTTRADFDKRSAQFRETFGSQREQLEELAAENTNLLRETGGGSGISPSLMASVSAPMRAAFRWLRRPLFVFKGKLHYARELIKRAWMRFRLKAIEKYHGISLTHPATAWTLRQLLRPFFRGMDRLLGDAPNIPLNFSGSGTSDRLRFQSTGQEQKFNPLVSVIVPNYNHAPYLALRLESIFSQTYENFEVILLDDASTDESVEILQTYHKRYPERSTLVANESNSGGVFHQWQRGLDLARGEIVWVAESDDWCTENFLQTLVPYFENEAVQLAYSRTAFMDKDGSKQVWSIEEYLYDVDPVRWTRPFVETGAEIVASGFSVKNIIPNVSSALFKTPHRLEILDDPKWREMRTCGDWVLYLHLIRGGMIAYSPLASNYYRMHGSNTSVASYAEDQFYREHEDVACTANQYYDVAWTEFERLRDNLGIHWRNTRNDYSAEAFENCFSLDRIQAAQSDRAPNLLMASYAFCAGGGETFPVSLANIMKGKGYNVTYLDCAQEPRMEGIRGRLRSDISVVSNFRQLELIVDAFNIDIIHSHHAWMESTILNLLPEDTALKLVVTLHGMYETMNEYDLKAILPRLARRISCFIYVADKNLTALRNHRLQSRVPLSRIDNALEVEQFDVVEREELGISEDAFVLTLVSRGMVEKGWVEAIQAVELAREDSGCDIHLLLVGDGPEYERLSEETLPQYIHLEGFQRNVRGYFAVADMGFLPSKFRGESFPLVIIECLQAGRPFLANDLGEIRHMLKFPEGDAGVVVDLAGDEVDIDAVAVEISKLASDEAYYSGLKAGVAQVVQRFDPAVLASKHDAVYRSVIEGVRPPA